MPRQRNPHVQGDETFQIRIKRKYITKAHEHKIVVAEVMRKALINKIKQKDKSFEPWPHPAPF